MNWRHEELAAFGPAIVPLGQPSAATVYGQAMVLCSRRRYGLDEMAFASIERLHVEDSGPDVPQWLAQRVGRGDVLMVFDRDSVFRVSAQRFIENWQDWFCPSRDDVVVVPLAGEWVLFYCHEDEFEFARIA